MEPAPQPLHFLWGQHWYNSENDRGVQIGKLEEMTRLGRKAHKGVMTTSQVLRSTPPTAGTQLMILSSPERRMSVGTD